MPEHQLGYGREVYFCNCGADLRPWGRATADGFARLAHHGRPALRYPLRGFSD